MTMYANQWNYCPLAWSVLTTASPQVPVAFRDRKQHRFALCLRLLCRHDPSDVDGIRRLGLVVQVRRTCILASNDCSDMLSDRYSQRHYKQSHDEGLHKFEHELKMRVRSATGTW